MDAASGYHSRSQILAPQATWSLTIERWASGGIWSRTSCGVGREDRFGRRRAARVIGGRAMIGGEIAAPPLPACEAELTSRREIKGREGQAIAGHLPAYRSGHGLREPRLIERRRPRPAPRIYHDELPPGGGRHAIPGPSVRQPARPAGDSTHQPAGGPAERTLGAGVVFGCQPRPCLPPRRRGDDGAEQDDGDCCMVRAHLERLLRRDAKGNYVATTSCSSIHDVPNRSRSIANRFAKNVCSIFMKISPPSPSSV